MLINLIYLSVFHKNLLINGFLTALSIMKLDKRSKFRYCKNWVQILTVCGVTFSSLQRGKQRGTESRNAWHSWQIVWFPYSRFIFLSLVSQLGALGLCCGTFELLHTALPNPCSLGDLPYFRSAYAMLCPVFLCYCVRPPSPPLWAHPPLLEQD